MLQAMNTGHDGSTGHANSTRICCQGLKPWFLWQLQFPLRQLRRDCFSHRHNYLSVRLRDHSRRVLGSCEVLEYKNGEIELNRIFEFEETGEDENGRVSGCLSVQKQCKHYKVKKERISLEEENVISIKNISLKPAEAVLPFSNEKM